MNLNHQATEPRALSDGTVLDVHSIFRTIQGEGPFTGHKAVFVRLAGCNLQCPLCDTEYTDGRHEQTAAGVCAEVKTLASYNGTKLVVITGGEPFRQSIARLCAMLVHNDFKVQIETNGKLPISDLDKAVLQKLVERKQLTIVISPKTERVNPFVASLCRHWKYVVSADDIAEDGLPTMALGNKLKPGAILARPGSSDPVEFIYVNPADHQDKEMNKRNLAAALDAVEHRTDSRRVLGLQLHKIYEVE